MSRIVPGGDATLALYIDRRTVAVIGANYNAGDTAMSRD